MTFDQLYLWYDLHTRVAMRTKDTHLFWLFLNELECLDRDYLTHMQSQFLIPQAD